MENDNIQFSSRMITEEDRKNPHAEFFAREQAYNEKDEVMAAFKKNPRGFLKELWAYRKELKRGGNITKGFEYSIGGL